jgi:hypothetical protein
MVSFDKAEQFDGFSKVVIIVSDGIEYSAGTDTGRTLTLNCPWGTQEIANNILQSIKGFQYQPMTAGSALVDPSVEIGDGVNANGVYSGVYSLETKFNSNLPATISAPSDEELYEEHTYVPKSEREVTRKFLEFQSQFRIQDGKISAEVEERKSDTKSIRATLEVQADQITAKVNKNDGHSSTFGWALETASWRIFSGSNTVLKADKNGLEVKGVIRATSGEIGGFKITSNSLTYNNQTWGGTNSEGIYIGPSGIQLGKNFKVDSAGNLTAASGTFSGYVKAGNIQYGDNSGYFSGSGISKGSISGGSGGKIAGATLSTFNLTGGVNTTLGYADFANGVFNGWNKASNILAGQLKITGTVELWNQKIGMKTAAVATPGGGSTTIYYLGYG